MIKELSTKGMSRKAWLEARRSSIGGSDAAAIIGLNDYIGPVSVWEEKTGRKEPPEPSEAMRIGTDLEEYVARRFSEATGKRVRRKNAILKNDLYPFAHANIDREIIGERAILECKTTSRLSLKKFRDGNYPANYYVQVMHYLAVTGAEKAYIAVLIFQEGLRVFEVLRDEEEVAALMEAERNFWQYVLRDEAPPGIRSEATETGKPIELFGRAEDMRKYLQLKEQAKALEADADRIADQLKKELGAYEAGTDGNMIAIWRNQTRTCFDRIAFQAAFPEMDLKPYMKTTQGRSFTVKEWKT